MMRSNISKNLQKLMRIIDPDHLTVREKDREPFPPDVSDLVVKEEVMK